MSYRPRPRFDQQSPDDLRRARKRFVWLFPLLVLQIAFSYFRPGTTLFEHLAGTTVWGVTALVLVISLFGIPLVWMSPQDRATLDDEWNRHVSGDAARWALMTSVLLGIVLMLVEYWRPLEPSMAVYGLVNGALLVAVFRYGWLNRGEPDEE